MPLLAQRIVDGNFLLMGDILASLVKPAKPFSGLASAQIVTVRCLDGVFEVERRFIDVFNIDTEGYELQSLKCLPSSVRKSRYMLVKCRVNKLSEGNIGDVGKYMMDIWPQFRRINVLNLRTTNMKLECIEVLCKNANLI